MAAMKSRAPEASIRPNRNIVLTAIIALSP